MTEENPPADEEAKPVTATATATVGTPAWYYGLVGIPVTMGDGEEMLLGLKPEGAHLLQAQLEHLLEPQDGEDEEEEEFDGDYSTADIVTARLAHARELAGEAATHHHLGTISLILLDLSEALRAPERYKARMSVTAYGNNVDELETYALELVEPYFPGRTTRIAECNMRIVGSVEQKERGCAVAANVVVEVVE